MNRAELINETLTRLGALPAGQEAAAEDYDYVEGRVEPVLADLSEREIAVVDPDDINDSAFMHVAAILAFHCKGYFGVVGQEAAQLLADNETAERKLRFYSRGKAINKPVRAEYF